MKQLSRLQKILLITAAIAAGAAVLIMLFWQQIANFTLRPTDSPLPTSTTTISEGDFRTVATDMVTPWAIGFLPDGDLLVTERSGQVQRIGNDGGIYAIEGVRETSEGGLLGVALHPDFAQNKYVYLYSTTDTGGTLTNRIERYQLNGRELRNRTEIMAGIPASANHDGGALAFGPDDKLYVTTGDAGNENASQDRQSLAGKILRINPDGSIPNDNPLNSAVWSYGHRNPQGIAWDQEDRLWATEHGRSGIQSGYDELNLIEKGANYGWPIIEGGETREGMKTPILHSGANDTWAPGGLAYADGSLYFTGLRGETLYRAKINSDSTVSLTRYFSGQHGRLRAVAIRNDELYFSTSNRDGRGSPASGDDHIYAVPLRLLNG
ncbi:MAG: PQQ-dependent sugar dehydrogenase [Candidatus Saccharimonadales bacterium]